jgi:GT2 family glycosyltransferase
VDTPLVTIAVLNYQRKDTLRQALARALEQSYPALEVLVVDNASTDGSGRMVAEEFPSVRLVRLPENVGCAARNAGVAAARGEIVVTIDNDVFLTDAFAVSRAVARFAAHPSVACVNFQVQDAEGRLSHRDWCHPRAAAAWSGQEFLTDYVLEGASAVRRSAFLAVGGYWPELFLGHEGLDLALRLLEAGHDLLYTPAVAVRHVVSAEARPKDRIYYTFLRNGVWIALRHHRPLDAATSIAKDAALVGFGALRGGGLRAYLRGWRDALRGAPAVWRRRRPLSPATRERLRLLRAEKPGLAYAVARHLRERLI